MLPAVGYAAVAASTCRSVKRKFDYVDMAPRQQREVRTELRASIARAAGPNPRGQAQALFDVLQRQACEVDVTLLPCHATSEQPVERALE